MEFRSIGTHSHLSLATSVGNRSMTSMWRERCDPKTKNTKTLFFFDFSFFFLEKTKKLTFSTNFASQLTYVESQVYQLFFDILTQSALLLSIIKTSSALPFFSSIFSILLLYFLLGSYVFRLEQNNTFLNQGFQNTY